ncbi:phenolic glucoside malonyltransferase 1-like [Humulus lupulus]|uniref:phenolic glucoside malonyltransferase 1-like n=1 Tax=Humulus lupulus TaxID=3486 RepID=UPI002B4075C7|nr:phenolic glucoside malonyltransferase 1-like [Humulus lupulus]
MASSPNLPKTLEVSHVAPFTASPETTTHFNLPLTFFDMIWFKFSPSERLFFYSLPEITKHAFLDSLLPKLKHSLSLTLQYFLPLAGKLTWPQDSPKPIVLYAPGDVVSVSVAESDADFDLLASNHAFQASAVRPLVPLLQVSETGASLIALQITVFPNHGFSIGVTTHHAVLDGKSAIMFMKSWAYLSKEDKPLLPELTPFYDRTVIKDPSGFDMKLLNIWSGSPGTTSSDCRNNPKLFEFFQFPSSGESSDLYRATFELSRSDMDKLRQRVSTSWDSSTHISPKPKLHLSSFALTYAYVFNCILKATERDEITKKVLLGFAVDYRNRFTPPVPENYFGNFVGGKFNYDDMRETLLGRKEDSLTALVVKISALIEEMGKQNDPKKEAEKILLKLCSTSTSENSRYIGVAGSPRFGEYSIDFGWGRPKKVAVLSIESGSISMVESKDGNGGIEVGLVLKKHQMDLFTFVFFTDLTNIS